MINLILPRRPLQVQTVASLEFDPARDIIGRPIIESSSLHEILDGSVAGVRLALQLAIQLEHATIPPYLYALYSIVPGKNVEIAEIIGSIVVEEMLHMSLACNVLNAIGGSPLIDDPAFIPSYPGPLPGGIESELKVGLCPVSIDLVKNVFMVIEEPEPEPMPAHPIRESLAGVQMSIGQFYRQIEAELKRLSPGGCLFTGDPIHQVEAPFPSCPLFKVSDLNSALRAIDTIVEQGEGRPDHPDSQSHYHRFGEIARGMDDAGRKIPLDKKDVYPVVSQHQQKVVYEVDTAAYNTNNTFNYTYTALLKTLHRVFNEEPKELPATIGLMESLKEQALTMMSSIQLPDGTMAGPTFEYHPTNG